MNVQGDEVILTKDRMICIILNAARISKNKFKKGVPLWCLVAELTGHGCTISTEICNSLGLNPCGKADKPKTL